MTKQIEKLEVALKEQITHVEKMTIADKDKMKALTLLRGARTKQLGVERDVQLLKKQLARLTPSTTPVATSILASALGTSSHPFS